MVVSPWINCIALYGIQVFISIFLAVPRWYFVSQESCFFLYLFFLYFFSFSEAQAEQLLFDLLKN